MMEITSRETVVGKLLKNSGGIAVLRWFRWLICKIGLGLRKVRGFGRLFALRLPLGKAEMAQEIKAPEKYDTTKYTVFLAGAIDQGKAVDWQKKVVQALSEFDIVILNPRREHWDPSWDQDASNPQFREQVEWELDAQESCNMIIFVFTADSKAPITFLEFGLFAPKKDAVICAEEEFYRQGNLDIVAERLKVPMYHNLDEMIADLQTLFREKV
jgi:hypothetical protein